MRSAAQRHSGLTVREAIDAYGQHLAKRGAKPATITFELCAARRLLEDKLGASISGLARISGSELYESMRQKDCARTRRPLAVDSHRGYLAHTRRFIDWCVAQGWLRANPLVGVEGVGRKRKGKPQLRLDEGARLIDACLQAGDPGALAVALALYTGLRSGEIRSRTVRDLDRGGTVLWVDDTDAWDKKTDNARRPIEIPECLRAPIAELAKDKTPAALLWSQPNGKPHGVPWLIRALDRMCDAAEVPRVVPHSLRGFAATAALSSGLLPQSVAAALGHASSRTTLQHYAAPGTMEGARVLAFDRSRKG